MSEYFLRNINIVFNLLHVNNFSIEIRHGNGKNCKFVTNIKVSIAIKTNKRFFRKKKKQKYKVQVTSENNKKYKRNILLHIARIIEY